MSLQKTVFTSLAFAALGFGVASSAIALPQSASSQETQISQTGSSTVTRTPAQVERLVQNGELVQIKLLTTGESTLVPTTTTRHTLDLAPGDYIIITTSDPNITRANVTDVEEVTEDQAKALLEEPQGNSTSTSGTSTTGDTSTSTTSTTRSTTTVQTQQPAPTPAPAPAARPAAPAPAPAPAPAQPVRALW